MSYLFGLNWEITWWSLIWWGGIGFALLHIPSVLLSRGSRPMAVLAWILCLLSLPFVGVILWWMIGRRHVERRQRRRALSHAEMTRSLADIKDTLSERQREKAAQTGSDLGAGDTLIDSSDLFCLRQNDGIFASTPGNQLSVLPSGELAFEAFEAAVREAKDHIHFEFYIWQNDSIGRRFRDLLTEKAREGVEVRVMYDAVGGAPVNRGFMKPLIEAGGHVAPFLPLSFFERQLRINFRNHRKIVVIDRWVGFIGGINIGEEYLDWVDMAFRIEGPASLQLQETFVEDWYFATGEDLGTRRYFLRDEDPEPEALAQLPDADDSLEFFPANSLPQDAPASAGQADEKASEPLRQQESPPAKLSQLEAPCVDNATARIIAGGPDLAESPIEAVFFLAITRSVERVYISTPYFVPDQAILVAIKTAALRGVDVRILTAGMSDVWLAQSAGRSFYEELLSVGVRIYEYTEQMIHAKAVVIDSEWVIVGSANMDMRSFLLNFEVNAVLKARSLNRYMSALIEFYIAQSEEMKFEDFAIRPLKHRIIESTARLFSPLL